MRHKSFIIIIGGGGGGGGDSGGGVSVTEIEIGAYM